MNLSRLAPTAGLLLSTGCSSPDATDSARFDSATDLVQRVRGLHTLVHSECRGFLLHDDSSLVRLFITDETPPLYAAETPYGVDAAPNSACLENFAYAQGCITDTQNQVVHCLAFKQPWEPHCSMNCVPWEK